MTATPAPAAALPLDEIRQLVRGDLPVLALEDAAMGAGARATAQWLAAVSGKTLRELRHPRIALFATGSAAAQDAMAAAQKGTHPACALALEGNADLQVYDLSAAGDLPASPQAAAHAMAYGMMAVQPGVDMLVLASLDDEEMEGVDNIDALGNLRRADVAAMAGVIVAARLARIPVVLSGSAAQAAARALTGENRDAALHARAAQDLMPQAAGLPAAQAGALAIPYLKAVARLGA